MRLRHERNFFAKGIRASCSEISLLDLRETIHVIHCCSRAYDTHRCVLSKLEVRAVKDVLKEITSLSDTPHMLVDRAWGRRSIELEERWCNGATARGQLARQC